MLDSVQNLVKVTASTGYNSGATSIQLSPGDGPYLPAAPFNMTWWDSTDYPDPSDDPNAEIIRVTAVSGDTLTILRGQENTTAKSHNLSSKTYQLILGITAKMISDIQHRMQSPVIVVATDGTGDYNTTGTADDVVINAAISLLNEIGGGTVYLKAGKYYPANPIVPMDKVSIIGVRPGLASFHSGSGPGSSDDYWTFDGTGTVFYGNGTFACFAYNNTVLNTTTGYKAANALKNIEISNLGITNFSCGIQFGAQENPGLYFSRISWVYVEGCSQWGFNFENFSENEFDHLFSVTNKVGDIRFANTSSQYQCGNSTMYMLYSSPANNFARGIVMESIGGAANLYTQLGVCHFFNPQVNRYRDGSPVTQTVTPSNGSASIAVTDLTKFALWMPVTFTTTANGFTANQTYFVASVSGSSGSGTITVANTKYGTAINGKGTTPFTCKIYGQPCFEVVGSPNTSGGPSVAGATGYSMDLEPTQGAAALYASQTISCFFQILTMIASPAANLVLRSSPQTVIISNSQSPADIDAGCSGMIWDGSRGTQIQRNVPGLYLDSVIGAQALNFSLGVGNTPDFYVRANGFLYPNNGIGECVLSRDNSITFNADYSRTVVFNGSSGQTFTLPSITNSSSGSSLVGLKIEIVNASANSLTVSTDGTQTFMNISSKTSTTMAPNSILRLLACTTVSGVLFWKASYELGSSLP